MTVQHYNFRDDLDQINLELHQTPLRLRLHSQPAKFIAWRRAVVFDICLIGSPSLRFCLPLVIKHLQATEKQTMHVKEYVEVFNRYVVRSLSHTGCWPWHRIRIFDVSDYRQFESFDLKVKRSNTNSQKSTAVFDREFYCSLEDKFL